MKILVVDDSRAMRMIVTRNLRQAGYDNELFSEAANGSEAYDMVQTNKPDLILSDWNMPEMNGIQFCQKLDPKSVGIIFGFVTSESTAAMRALAKEAGASFLIAKPFSADTFQQVIGQALAK